jgi:DNA polymerase III epsilon subunit-like protein
MSGIEFYCLDSESNGLKVNFHELTQICCIRASDRLQFDKTIRCHYPERSQAMALQITGKTRNDLRQGEEQLAVIEAFEQYLASDGKTPKARCIIAHNRSFDQRFLHALWAQHKKIFPADLWVDTIPMTRAFGKKQGMTKVETNLQAAMRLVGVTKKAAGIHNAVSDSRNLYFLWNKLIETEDYLHYIKRIPHVLDGNESVNDSSD